MSNYYLSCIPCCEARTTSSTGVSLSKRWPAANRKNEDIGSPASHQRSKRMRRTLQHVDIIELQAAQAVLHRIIDMLPALAVLVHEAEAVGIRGTPKALPGLAANREVQLWFRFLALVHPRRTWKRYNLTLVMTTISSRGRLSCLMALPSMISEAPLEYTLPRSKVPLEDAASQEMDRRAHVSGVKGLDAVLISITSEIKYCKAPI